MSSHHDWVADITAQHDADKPFAPENGQPLAFQPGDPVIYTNEYGIEFPRTITGHFQPALPCGLYARGYRYLVNSTSPWMPVTQASLRLDRARALPH